MDDLASRFSWKKRRHPEHRAVFRALFYRKTMGRNIAVRVLEILILRFYDQVLCPPWAYALPGNSIFLNLAMVKQSQ